MSLLPDPAGIRSTSSPGWKLKFPGKSTVEFEIAGGAAVVEVWVEAFVLALPVVVPVVTEVLAAAALAVVFPFVAPPTRTIS
eukprot:6022750-Amphidinium_carterae.1